MLRSLSLAVCVLAALAGCQPSQDAVAQVSQGGRSDSQSDQQPADPEPSIVGQGSLEGTYFVSGPMGEGDLIRDSTHLYLWMEGGLAAELYRRMSVAPEPYHCEPESRSVKQGREITCTVNADSTDHRCYVAIDVPAETLAVGVIC